MQSFFEEHFSMRIMHACLDRIQDWLISTLPFVLLVLFLAIVAAIVLRFAVKRLNVFLLKQAEDDPHPEGSKRRVATLSGITRKTGQIAIWTIAVMVILGHLGVQIGPIVAGAGIAGIAIGFGAQNLVRDIISGFFILLEDQVRIGDVAVINGTGGTVEEINIRTIVLRDGAGTIHIFRHGLVETLSNRTKQWSAAVFDINVAYREDTDAVVRVMEEVATRLRDDAGFADKIIEPMEVFGVAKFTDSAVVINARMKTKPMHKWTVEREYRRRLKKAFEENGIEIPFPHCAVVWGGPDQPLNVKLEGRSGYGAK